MSADRIGGLFVISAPSGTGKSSVIKGVRATVSDLAFSVSYTTREPREGEVDGVHYHFVSEETFKQMIAEGAFLEYARVFDRFYYGTALQPVRELLDQGVDVIMDIDVQGACQIIERDDVPHTSIFLIPPSMRELRARLTARNRDTAPELEQRLKTARAEIVRMDCFAYVVLNDDLDQAVRDVASIVVAERKRTGRIRDVEELKNKLLRED